MMSEQLSARLGRGMAEAAGAAPSLHNTQPWQFAVEGDAMLLYAVPERALGVADPNARGLYLSCGAALYNARTAGRELGYDVRMRLLPHPEYPLDVLAVLDAEPGAPPSATESARYGAIWRRHTNRGAYSDRRIAPSLAARLAQAAAQEHATLQRLDPHQTRVLLDLAAGANRKLSADTAHQDELSHWIRDGAPDGIPPWALPMRPLDQPSPVRDDMVEAAEASPPVVPYEHSPQVAILSTAENEPADWLQAGLALEKVLLIATMNGLSASFLYQLIEREEMYGESLGPVPWRDTPQMVMRLGYAHPAVPTPRRRTESIMRRGAGLRLG
jgi:hypothetical protein